MFTEGFLPGRNLTERMALFTDPMRMREAIPAARAAVRDYEAGGAEAAFVYTFANRHLPTTDDPAHDYDLAARGIVRVPPDGSWTPKAAFHTLAEYGRARRRPAG